MRALEWCAHRSTLELFAVHFISDMFFLFIERTATIIIIITTTAKNRTIFETKETRLSHAPDRARARAPTQCWRAAVTKEKHILATANRTMKTNNESRNREREKEMMLKLMKLIEDVYARNG